VLSFGWIFRVKLIEAFDDLELAGYRELGELQVEHIGICYIRDLFN
jgi:hypothetical protein